MTARLGQTFVCKHCGDQFYRRPSHVRRGITKTCGKRQCISQSMMGENNPFWNGKHPPELREKLSTMRKARSSPRPRKPVAAGHYSHSPEAREKIAEATRRRWVENRDKMLEACEASKEATKGLNIVPRYRMQFTPMQRRDWIDCACRWCSATDDLVLDHVIPVSAGGSNKRTNAQTLCRTCNLWKMTYVDRPYVIAALGEKEG